MLIATIISLSVTIGSFVWLCVITFKIKRPLKLWEATCMYAGMSWGAIISGLLLSTFLV